MESRWQQQKNQSRRRPPQRNPPRKRRHPKRNDVIITTPFFILFKKHSILFQMPDFYQDTCGYFLKICLCSSKLQTTHDIAVPSSGYDNMIHTTLLTGSPRYSQEPGKSIQGYILEVFLKNKKCEMRRPGLEPGFRRWQRLVITTTLSAQCALKCEHSNDLRISNSGHILVIFRQGLRHGYICFAKEIILTGFFDTNFPKVHFFSVG